MITIIGAGPVGCYAGYCLAKKGKEVNIIEEHKKIGLPVQCTGIVTSSLNKIINPKKEFIINKINRARIFSRKNSVEIRLKSPNLILDRHKFDRHIAEMAKSQGVKILLEEKFIGNSKNKVKTSKHSFDADYIIGADGPLSSVAKANNMLNNRQFWHGIQARVKLKNDNSVDFYPGIGTIAWVVPENKETARVGLMAPGNANIIFKKFLKKITGNKGIIEYQAGLIPVYNPRQKAQKENILLIGDAAAQVKATTGGGIIQGLTAAECAANSISENISYEKAWRGKIGRDLWLHLKIRGIMDRFNEQDLSTLIRKFKKIKNREILENFDRDYPSKFLLRLFLREPSLALFAKCLFRQPAKQKSF